MLETGGLRSEDPHSCCQNKTSKESLRLYQLLGSSSATNSFLLAVLTLGGDLQRCLSSHLLCQRDKVAHWYLSRHLR